jgi:hypothetical protein
MGYRKLSARPRHHFQKSFLARLEKVAQKKSVDSSEIEIWFADEVRIGQKNKITRR